MTAVTTAVPARRELDRRGRPGAAVSQGLTLAWRSLVHTRNTPEQLIDVSLQPIIFVLLFTFLFGGAVDGSWQDYLQYVLPGIAVQTVLFATLGTGIGLNSDISKGVFDRFRSLPISRSAPLVGHVLGDTVRYVISLTVVLGFGIALGFRVHTNVFYALAACGLMLGFALAMCWIAALVGLLAKTPESVQGFGFLVLFPLTFASSVFVKASTLPGWLQAWVKINPVTKLTDSVRNLLVGGPLASPVLQTVAWAVGIVAVFAPLAIRSYRRHT